MLRICHLYRHIELTIWCAMYDMCLFLLAGFFPCVALSFIQLGLTSMPHEYLMMTYELWIISINGKRFIDLFNVQTETILWYKCSLCAPVLMYCTIYIKIHIWLWLCTVQNMYKMILIWLYEYEYSIIAIMVWSGICTNLIVHSCSCEFVRVCVFAMVVIIWSE